MSTCEFDICKKIVNKDVRINVLREAEAQFSKSGFYGTSINNIAKGMGLTKQGILHYFPTKEKLYAAVLESAANSLTDDINTHKSRLNNPKHVLETIFKNMVEAKGREQEIIVLLLRELLDNRERAIDSNRWFLKPYLDELISLAKAANLKDCHDDISAFVVIYELLGSIQYLLISEPTLTKLYSDKQFEKFKKQHLSRVISTFRY